jgi:hypothetical protein
VRIQAWRPIVCEYAKGPSFALSEKEEAALAEALKSWGGDAALAGLEPVGWYRAHTRSEVLLSDADLAFFNRFFPQPWQAGLIVRPTSFAPTRAGFFFREADGGIRAESSYHEFTLMPVAMEQAATDQAAEDAPAIPAAAPGVALPNAARAAEPHPVWASAPQPPLRGTGAARKWYAAGLGLLVFAVLGFWLLKPSAQGLKLSATDIGGQLRIAWDGTADQPCPERMDRNRRPWGADPSEADAGGSALRQRLLCTTIRRRGGAADGGCAGERAGRGDHPVSETWGERPRARAEPGRRGEAGTAAPTGG